MFMKPPLVPSKEALRLLRQLAFAGSTLAAVGVVTVNYHVYRQIRCVEQCLETKRQIRALSNGNGQALLARMIEAAENGQDFSVQAMREQRIRERSFTPSTDEIARPQRSGGQPTQHNEVRAYRARERNAQKIRKATAAMTSNPPKHVYARPKQFSKPAPCWPSVESDDTQVRKPSAPLASIGTISANAKEAAEKIKKATIAMTSTGSTHVFGRPKPAVLEARPILHASVALWLGETATFQMQAGAAPALTESSLTSVMDASVSLQNNTTTFSAANSDERLGGALGQLSSGAGESEPTLGNSILAERFQRTATVQHHYQDEMSKPTPNVLRKRIEEDTLRQLDPGMRTIFSKRCVSLRNTIPTRHLTVRSLSSLDVVDVKPNTTTSMLLSQKMTDHDEIKPASSAVSTGLNTQNSIAVDLLKSFQDRQASEAFSSQEILSSCLTDCADEGKYGARTMDESLAIDKSRLGPIKNDKETSPTGKPPSRVQLQRQTDGARSIYVLRPHLEPLYQNPSPSEQRDQVRAPGENTAEESPKLSLEGTDAQNTKTSNGQNQVTRRWIPFPKSSSAPIRTNSQRNLDQDLATEHTCWSKNPLEEVRPSQYISNKLRKRANVVGVMTAEERVELALHIQNVFSCDGLVAGQRDWKHAAHARLEQKDLAAVDFLYAEFVEKGVVKVSPRHHLTRALIQWHYERGKFSARAAEILFPDPEVGENCFTASIPRRRGGQISPFTERRTRCLFAMRFLQGLWELRANSEWLMLYFRRVIAAAKFRAVKLVEELFALVIRFLASVGDMTRAQALYDEMIFYHQIEASFLSRTLLLRGYSRINDWYRVEREIEELHYRGLSRSRPHGFALMFNVVLEEYAARSSAEQLQDFLIRAVSYWGLIPTSAISATVVQAYLSRQRYDLVREWMETLQVLFPQIQTETGSFQWLMGNSWKRTGASCQQIEAAIKALAYRNPRTKMKSHSVSMIHEALAQDLAIKVNAVKAKMAPNPQSPRSVSTEANDFNSTNNIEDYLSSAFSLPTLKVSQTHMAIPEVADLHCQVAAAQRVNSFLTGNASSKTVEEFSFPDPEPDTTGTHVKLDRGPTVSSSTLAHLQDSVPIVLTAESLPEASTITAAILDFYRNRSVRGLPIDHSLLPWVGEKLLETGRAFDAVVIIQKVYENRMVRRLINLEIDASSRERPSDGGHQGQESGAFGIEFFEFWMQLAWVTRSLVQWKRVVEEVLRHSTPRQTISYDSSDGALITRRTLLRRVRVTSSFVFLTRLVAKRGLRARWSKWSSYDGGDPVDELVWLLWRLENRREQQTGKRDTRTGSRLKDNLI